MVVSESVLVPVRCQCEKFVPNSVLYFGEEKKFCLLDLLQKRKEEKREEREHLQPKKKKKKRNRRWRWSDRLAALEA